MEIGSDDNIREIELEIIKKKIDSTINSTDIENIIHHSIESLYGEFGKLRIKFEIKKYKDHNVSLVSLNKYFK